MRSTRNLFGPVTLILSVCVFLVNAGARRSAGGCAGAEAAGESQAAGQPGGTGPSLIQPADLAGVLKSTASPKPLMIQVGFHVLYVQAHIPGSEYIGPGVKPEAIQQLRKRIESLPRDRFIVLYCGCCPWNECPNLKPAHKELDAMGFKNVKLLYIAHNFGEDWVAKGCPVARGQ